MLRCSEEGGNLILAEVREFLHPVKTRSGKREESRDAERFFGFFNGCYFTFEKP